MKFIVIIFPLLSFLQLKAQQKIISGPVFTLLDSSNKGAINYTDIDSINKFSGVISLLSKVFNIKEGHEKIFRFITADSAFIFDESGKKPTHTLVLLKVDNHNLITDGYWYFLENATFPFTCNLYRLTKHLSLKNNLDLTRLRFKKTHQEVKEYEVCESPEILYNVGILNLEKRSK